MPTLTRLLLGLFIAIVVGYAVIYALATFVTPEVRTISIPIPERGESKK